MKFKDIQMENKNLHATIVNLEKCSNEKESSMKKLEKEVKKMEDESILQNTAIKKKMKGLLEKESKIEYLKGKSVEINDKMIGEKYLLGCGPKQ